MSAPETVDSHVDSTSIELSERDQQAFLEALLNPPEPNDALRRAAAAYLGR